MSKNLHIILDCFLIFFTECNCHEHATACRYDSNLETGACIGCIDNTTGTHCDECIDRFYRNTSKVLNDTDVCLGM